MNPGGFKARKYTHYPPWNKQYGKGTPAEKRHFAFPPGLLPDDPAVFHKLTIFS